MTSMPAGAEVIASIERQLDGLRKTADGEILYRLIDKGLRRRDGNFEGTTAQAFIEFLHNLLGRYAANPEGDTATRVKVRLLQQRLAPHVQENAPVVPAAAVNIAQGSRSTPPAGRAASEPEAVNAAPTIESIEISAPEPSDEPGWEPAARVPAAGQETDAAVDLDSDQWFLKTAPAPDRPASVADAAASSGTEPSSPGAVGDTPAGPASEAGASRQHDLADASPERPLFGGPESDIALTTETLELDEAVTADVANTAPDAPPAVPEWNNEIVVNTRDVDPGTPPFARDTPFRKTSAPDPHSIDFTSGNIEAVKARSQAAASAPPAAPKPAASARKPARTVSTAPSPTAPKPPSVPRKSASPAPRAVSGEVVPRKDKGARTSRERVDKLHETFAGKLADSLSRSKEFHRLVRSNLKALQLASDPGDVMDLRHLLVRGLEDLLEGTESLGKDLGATSHYLKISALDRNLLKDELSRVRGNSMVDEATGLQNKKAFLKQLRAEIGRAKRYGFSLALAVLEVNGLGVLESETGKDVAREILTTYAKEILSQFRSYDLVARIGDHRFAVMFPNTQKEGAVAALEKAQKRASGMAIQNRGAPRGLPGFSSVLTLYAPGDRPDMLLKRADDALILAKGKGVNRILVALPAQ